MRYASTETHASVEKAVELLGLGRSALRRIDAHPDLERLAPVALNVVCFRFVERGASDEAVDALNREILCRLGEEGVAVPSFTTLSGRIALRVALTNHRTRREDLDVLVEAVVRLGRSLAGGSR